MKTALLTIAILATGFCGVASAEVLPGHLNKVKCNFTEPFAILLVNLNSKKIEVRPMEGPSKTLSNLTVRRGGHGDIELLKSGKSILQIVTIENGSDGMSDRVYDATGHLFTGEKMQTGGCDFEYPTCVRKNLGKHCRIEFADGTSEVGVCRKQNDSPICTSI